MKLESKPYERALQIMERGGPAEDAHALLLAAIESLDFRAHYALGTWYLFGRVVPINLKKAVSLFQHAADAGIAEAAFDLAVCYEKGKGVRKNLPKAAALYFRAHRCGDESASEELHRMFYWGIGVTKNRMIAAELEMLGKQAGEIQSGNQSK